MQKTGVIAVDSLLTSPVSQILVGFACLFVLAQLQEGRVASIVLLLLCLLFSSPVCEFE